MWPDSTQPNTRAPLLENDTLLATSTQKPPTHPRTPQYQSIHSSSFGFNEASIMKARRTYSDQICTQPIYKHSDHETAAVTTSSQTAPSTPKVEQSTPQSKPSGIGAKLSQNLTIPHTLSGNSLSKSSSHTGGTPIAPSNSGGVHSALAKMRFPLNNSQSIAALSVLSGDDEPESFDSSRDPLMDEETELDAQYDNQGYIDYDNYHDTESSPPPPPLMPVHHRHPSAPVSVISPPISGASHHRMQTQPVVVSPTKQTLPLSDGASRPIPAPPRRDGIGANSAASILSPSSVGSSIPPSRFSDASQYAQNMRHPTGSTRAYRSSYSQRKDITDDLNLQQYNNHNHSQHTRNGENVSTTIHPEILTQRLLQAPKPQEDGSPHSTEITDKSISPFTRISTDKPDIHKYKHKKKKQRRMKKKFSDSERKDHAIWELPLDSPQVMMDGGLTKSNVYTSLAGPNGGSGAVPRRHSPDRKISKFTKLMNRGNRKITFLSSAATSSIDNDSEEESYLLQLRRQKYGDSLLCYCCYKYDCCFKCWRRFARCMSHGWTYKMLVVAVLLLIITILFGAYHIVLYEHRYDTHTSVDWVPHDLVQYRLLIALIIAVVSCSLNIFFGGRYYQMQSQYVTMKSTKERLERSLERRRTHAETLTLQNQKLSHMNAFLEKTIQHFSKMEDTFQPILPIFAATVRSLYSILGEIKSIERTLMSPDEEVTIKTVASNKSKSIDEDADDEKAVETTINRMSDVDSAYHIAQIIGIASQLSKYTETVRQMYLLCEKHSRQAESAILRKLAQDLEFSGNTIFEDIANGRGNRPRTGAFQQEDYSQQAASSANAIQGMGMDEVLNGVVPYRDGNEGNSLEWDFPNDHNMFAGHFDHFVQNVPRRFHNAFTALKRHSLTNTSASHPYHRQPNNGTSIATTVTSATRGDITVSTGVTSPSAQSAPDLVAAAVRPMARSSSVRVSYKSTIALIKQLTGECTRDIERIETHRKERDRIPEL